MSVCQIQVNEPRTVQGVNILPGTYAGEQHRRRSDIEGDADDVSYTVQLPVDSSADGTVGSVQTLNITALVRSGAVIVLTDYP